MDISETYIRMCEKAEEITINRRWEAGDWGYWPSNGDINVMYSGEYMPQELGEGHLWLPRQDQLQEMVGDFETCQYRMNDFMLDFNLDRKDLPYWKSFNSYEQLWLAFVMKEKYNKVWSNDKWVLEGEK